MREEDKPVFAPQAPVAVAEQAAVDDALAELTAAEVTFWDKRDAELEVVK